MILDFWRCYLKKLHKKVVRLAYVSNTCAILELLTLTSGVKKVQILSRWFLNIPISWFLIYLSDFFTSTMLKVFGGIFYVIALTEYNVFAYLSVMFEKHGGC